MAYEIQEAADLGYHTSPTNVTAPTYSGPTMAYASGGIPQYYAVVLDTSTGFTGDVMLAGANAAIIGVAQDGPAVGPGQMVRVRVRGVTKMIAGAAIAEGAQLATDASGRAVTAPAPAATDSPVIGVAETAATQIGDVVSVRLIPGAMTTVNV